jgi:hypothetical protein
MAVRFGKTAALRQTVGTKSDSYRRSHDLDLSGHGTDRDRR